MIQATDVENLKTLDTLKTYCSARLNKDRANRAYVCPFCGSGTKEHGTSQFTLRMNKEGDAACYTCFACGAHGSITGLAAHLEGIPDDEMHYPQLLEAVARTVGVFLNTEQPPTQTRMVKQAAPREPAEPPKDYTEGREWHRRYIKDMRANIGNPDAAAYLEKRGWTVEQATAAGIGYDPRKRVLVLPWKGCDYYHIDRAVYTDESGLKYRKPPKDNTNAQGVPPVGEQPLCNKAALETESVVYVCEGLFDALSLEQNGVAAVPLAGVGRNKLLEAVRALPKKPMFVVFPDRDETGLRAGDALREELRAAGANVIVVEEQDFSEAGCEGKDADEMRQRTPEAMRALVSRLNDVAKELTTQKEKQAAEAAERARRQAMKDAGIVPMLEEVERLFHGEGMRAPVPTGLDFLDEALHGGLPQGLTILGAASSTGKTTLLLHIADNIAASGTPVLFVSIEQRPNELAAMTLSRLMAQAGCDVSRSDVLNPAARKAWSADAEEAMLEACGRYAGEIAPNLHVMCGTTRPGTADVANAAMLIRGYEGQPPVVMIDYLQLLKPENDRDTDKTTVDKHMTALRRLSGDLCAPIVCISSLNRDSYDTDITTAALKESGSLEYCADLILGMQTSGTNMLARAKVNNLQARLIAAREKNEAQSLRQVELKMLKNRNGERWQEPLQLIIDVRHNEALPQTAKRRAAFRADIPAT